MGDETIPARESGGGTPLVSVVIPVYNRLDYTRRCLESLRSLTYPKLETIVVDNGSKDGTVEAVEREFPWARVIRNATNLGYGGGCNVGIRESRGVYVLVLNNDTKVVDPHLLQSIVAVFETNPRVAVVGPRMVDYRDYDKIKFDGENDPYGDHEVSGAAPTFRRKALDEVGLFDEFYFAYFEDRDLFARLKKAGWLLRHLPEVRLAHEAGATGVTGSSFAVYWGTRNFLIFMRRHATLPRIVASALPYWTRLTALFLFESFRIGNWPGLSAWGRGLRDGFRAALSDQGNVARA